jgi:hypothetical protein
VQLYNHLLRFPSQLLTTPNFTFEMVQMQRNLSRTEEEKSAYMTAAKDTRGAKEQTNALSVCQKGNRDG